MNWHIEWLNEVEKDQDLRGQTFTMTWWSVPLTAFTIGWKQTVRPCHRLLQVLYQTTSNRTLDRTRPCCCCCCCCFVTKQGESKSYKVAGVHRGPAVREQFDAGGAAGHDCGGTTITTQTIVSVAVPLALHPYYTHWLTQTNKHINSLVCISTDKLRFKKLFSVIRFSAFFICVWNDTAVRENGLERLSVSEAGGDDPVGGTPPTPTHRTLSASSQDNSRHRGCKKRGVSPASCSAVRPWRSTLPTGQLCCKATAQVLPQGGSGHYHSTKLTKFWESRLALHPDHTGCCMTCTFFKHEVLTCMVLKGSYFTTRREWSSCIWEETSTCDVTK